MLPFILGFVFQVNNICFILHLHRRPTVRVKLPRFGRVVFVNKTAIPSTYLWYFPVWIAWCVCVNRVEEHDRQGGHFQWKKKNKKNPNTFLSLTFCKTKNLTLTLEALDHRNHSCLQQCLLKCTVVDVDRQPGWRAGNKAPKEIQLAVKWMMLPVDGTAHLWRSFSPITVL